MSRAAVLFLVAASHLACSRADVERKAPSAALAHYVSAAPPPDMIKADVDFDDKVHLVGYTVAPRLPVYAPGTSVTVALVWRSDVKLEPGWLLFSHLVGGSGEQLDNLDDKGPLRRLDGVTGQPLPPSQWEPGSFYRDELTFTIPADAPPLVVVGPGIYKGKTRLVIKGGGGDR